MDNIRKKTEICLDGQSGASGGVSNLTSANITSASQVKVDNSPAATTATVKPIANKPAQSVSAPNTGVAADSILPLVILAVVLVVGLIGLIKKGRRYAMFIFAVALSVPLGLPEGSVYAAIPGCQNVGYSEYDIVVEYNEYGASYDDNKVIKIAGTGDFAKDSEIVKKIDERLKKEYRDAAIKNMDIELVKEKEADGTMSFITRRNFPYWSSEQQIYRLFYGLEYIQH